MAGLLLGATLLAGCVAIPDLGPRPQPRPADSYAAAQSLGPVQADAAWPDADWWRAYGDPQLDALVAEGLKGAPDVAAASARLHSAEGYRQQARAALRPTLDAKGNIDGYYVDFPDVAQTHGVAGNAGAILSANFDIDLWGKNRAALRAATSDSYAARLDLEEARLLLSTGIASAYADLARLFAERDVQAAAVTLRMNSQKLVANRVTTGLDTRAELKQADSAIPAARAELAATDESIALTRNRIAALIGAGPDRGLAIARPTVAMEPRPLPADATTNLIGRRPDIAAARARVESEAQRIKVARADFFPAISLTGLAGYESLGLTNLLKGGPTVGTAQAAVTLPIFHGGAISGRYRTARASYDEAVANYDKSVAGAYQDVADAVASRRMLVERLAQSRQALSDAEAAYDVARQRYEGGLSTYLTVLTAEDTVLQNRRTVADLQSRAFTLDVALVRALGGGLVPPSSSAAAGADSSKDAHHG